MRGLFTLTFEVDGTDSDEIKAAGLELKRLFNAAAAKRETGFKPGTFHCVIDGAPEKPPETSGNHDDPARLFDA